jgi:hypothetical protein
VYEQYKQVVENNLLNYFRYAFLHAETLEMRNTTRWHSAIHRQVAAGFG